MAPEPVIQAKELLQLVDGKLQLNQIKLMLRGDGGLAQRLHRQRFDAPRMLATLMSTAVRYRLQIQEPTPKKPTAEKKQVSASWTEVVQKSTRRKGAAVKKMSDPAKKEKVADETKQTEPTKDNSRTTLELKDGTWSQKVLKKFALGQAGVFRE